MLPNLHAVPTCCGTYERVTDDVANPELWQCPKCRASQYIMKEFTAAANAPKS